MRIELKDVGVQFDGKEPLFTGVDLDLGSRDFVVVQGPSGGGKTTLLRLLNRLQEPTAGSILVDGKPMHDLDVLDLRRRVGYFQQQPVMLDGSVMDNLRLPFRYGIARGQTPPSEARLRQRMDQFLLEGVELTDDASKLSVGQQQRVALIRSLSVEPEILLCDEPTSALDPESTAVVEASLERVCREDGVGIVMVTHLAFKPRELEVRRLRLTPGDGLQEVQL